MYILLPEVTIVCSHAKHLQVHVHSGHHQQAVVFTGIPFIVLPDNLETGSNAAHYQHAMRKKHRVGVLHSFCDYTQIHSSIHKRYQSIIMDTEV